jgi:hypothetical protein
MPLYKFIHSLLTVLVQIANKMGFKKLIIIIIIIIIIVPTDNAVTYRNTQVYCCYRLVLL